MNANLKSGTIVRGYKVFYKDFTCFGGFQYETDKEYTMEEDPVCGKRGFHFCIDIKKCFNYYDFDPRNKVAEVEVFGKIDKGNDEKYCTNGIRIVRELSWNEALSLADTGKNFTGFWNVGSWNTGSWNTGHMNTGKRNSGNDNTGDNNTGNWNTGDSNIGNRNTGSRNTGNFNIGIFNTGDGNTGSCNTGDKNAGDKNAGDRNTGNWNTGSRNTGNRNTGDWNTGDYNTGNYNTGIFNTGDWNAGDCNTSNWNTGCFNTKKFRIRMFNKYSKMTLYDWLESEARALLLRIPKFVVEWVSSKDMTDEEKRVYSEYETTGGYLKVLNESEVATLWWNSLSEEEKNVFKELPNFDFKIFCKCMGIKAE